jgi:hypothetical protein
MKLEKYLVGWIKAPDNPYWNERHYLISGLKEPICQIDLWYNNNPYWASTLYFKYFDISYRTATFSSSEEAKENVETIVFKYGYKFLPDHLKALL